MQFKVLKKKITENKLSFERNVPARVRFFLLGLALIAPIILIGASSPGLSKGSSECVNISHDTKKTYSVALGDVDGDGDLDLVAGNADFPGGGALNHLYLNNGTRAPFKDTRGMNIALDSHNTYSVVLGDINRDGHVDIVAGNYGRNRLYLNKGTGGEPFKKGCALDIGLHEAFTMAIILYDIDRDGDPDLITGNFGAPNRLYINNGSSNPFGESNAWDISGDMDGTMSLACGDINGDGAPDIVAGNYGRNRIYLNNGLGRPFENVSGTDLSEDESATLTIALGDVNGDGKTDIITGNGLIGVSGETNRLYLNNGSANPFEGAVGQNISEEAHVTRSLFFVDADLDGDKDIIAGNENRDRLYLNNGKDNPFKGAVGKDVSLKGSQTGLLLWGDVDGDGKTDIMSGYCLIPGAIGQKEK